MGYNPGYDYRATYFEDQQKIEFYKSELLKHQYYIECSKEENAKLKRLLAEACYMVGNHRMIFVSKDLEQWYEAHKKEKEAKNED